MISSNSNVNCDQAKIYYYDWLENEGNPDIPESVSQHIRLCQHCQTEINRLKECLEQETDDQEHELRSLSIASNMKMHLSYVDKKVTCDDVKQFLPGQADYLLKVKVPTPITAHVDRCPECMRDLESIQAFKLTHKQLLHLGQILACAPIKEDTKCHETQKQISKIAVMQLDNISSETLNHICLCPACRKGLFDTRQAIIDQIAEKQNDDTELSCENVSWTDLFEYCFPYGLDSEKAQHSKSQSPLISHVSTCRVCLEKMQQLHKSVNSILERHNSEVITRFVVDEESRELLSKEVPDTSSNLPIKIELIKEQLGATVDTSNHKAPLRTSITKVKPKKSTSSIARLVEVFAVAAAIMIVFWLVFGRSSAIADELEQIYKAVGSIKNVWIKSTQPDSKPIQEMWISPQLQVMLHQTHDTIAYWDVPNERATFKNLKAGTTTHKNLSKTDLPKVRKQIAGLSYLLPFDDIDNIPEDTDWKEVPPEELGTKIENTKVFDLIWKDQDSKVSRKWRGYIDIDSNLPLRIESWNKLESATGYNLITITTVEYYKAPDKIKSAIKNAGF